MLFARGSPRKPAKAGEARTLLTIFYGFLDDFFTALFVLLYMQYEVRQCIRSLSMQYKSLLPFLRGGGGGGGTGGGCKSYSMDSLLLSKRD